MHVPGAEVIPVLAKAMVASQGDLLAGPFAVADRAYINVEIPVWLAGNVGYAGAIPREHRVHIKLVVAGQWVGLASRSVQDLELDRAPIIVGVIDDAFT